MKVNFEKFCISSKYTGSKPAPWDEHNYNHHTITVTNRETGEKTRFDFWSSIVQPQIEKEYDLLNAFYCFVSDAFSGEQSFSDFCADFGYDEDSRKAWNTWKACVRSARKWERISGFSEIENCEFFDRLQEIGG